VQWDGPVRFASDNREILAAGYEIRQNQTYTWLNGLLPIVVVLDAESGKEVRRLRCFHDESESYDDSVADGVTQIALLPGGRTIATVTNWGVIQWWDLTSGQEIRGRLSTKAYGWYLAFNSDMSLAAYRSRTNLAVVLVQTADGHALNLWEDGRWEGSDRWLEGIRFSPRARTLAIAEGNQVRLIDFSADIGN
jgi:hypothetical protein